MNTRRELLKNAVLAAGAALLPGQIVQAAPQVLPTPPCWETLLATHNIEDFFGWYTQEALAEKHRLGRTKPCMRRLLTVMLNDLVLRDGFDAVKVLPNCHDRAVILEGWFVPAWVIEQRSKKDPSWPLLQVHQKAGYWCQSQIVGLLPSDSQVCVCLQIQPAADTPEAHATCIQHMARWHQPCIGLRSSEVAPGEPPRLEMYSRERWLPPPTYEKSAWRLPSDLHALGSW
jgi:hypothetical protein